MKFDKDFNPGSGNTFNEWNIDYVENLNPAATTVTTIHNHNREERSACGCGGRKKLDDDQKKAIREELLEYVSRLDEKVKPKWKPKFATLWDAILKIPGIDAMVYNPGQQKNTHFNRNLVGKIIKVLMKEDVLEGNATDLTRILEGTEKHSIREEIGKNLPEDLEAEVKKLLK